MEKTTITAAEIDRICKFMDTLTTYLQFENVRTPKGDKTAVVKLFKRHLRPGDYFLVDRWDHKRITGSIVLAYYAASKDIVIATVLENADKKLGGMPNGAWQLPI